MENKKSLRVEELALSLRNIIKDNGWDDSVTCMFIGTLLCLIGTQASTEEIDEHLKKCPEDKTIMSLDSIEEIYKLRALCKKVHFKMAKFLSLMDELKKNDVDIKTFSEKIKKAAHEAAAQGKESITISTFNDRLG